MRVYKMTATFGKLDRAELVLKPGLNILEAPNEWGKSTWCAFLTAMLYGLDTRAKSTKTALADKERYAPWSGKPMSGRIDLCWQGRDITIERHTRGRIPLGQFRAYETDTGLDVPELTAQTCGEVLLGVERSVFRRAGFVQLSDLPVTQDEALRRRLSNLVTTGNENEDAENLGRELKDLRNRIRYNRSGLLPQTNLQLEELEQKLEELTDLEQNCRNLRQRQEELAQEQEKLENHKKALAYSRAQAGMRRLAQARENWQRSSRCAEVLEQECSKLPSAEEAEEKTASLRALVSRMEAVRQEESMLPPVPEEEAQTGIFAGKTGQEAMEQAFRDGQTFRQLREGSNLWVWWILSALSAAAAIALYFRMGWPYGAAALVSGLLFLLLGIRKQRILHRKLEVFREKYGNPDPENWLLQAREHDRKQKEAQHRRHAYQQSRSALDIRLQGLNQQYRSLCGGQEPEKVMEIWQRILDRWEALDRARREAAQAEALYRALQDTALPAQPPAMADSLTCSEEETDLLLERNREEQRLLQHRLGQYQGRMETLGHREDLNARCQQLRLRTRKLEETYEALTLALDTLQEARRELQRRFAPRITARAAELLERLTAGRYDRLTLSEDFSLLTAAREESTLQSILWRSEGTVDQLYFALRLAVAEELTPHAPLILDDALARFDDTRLKAAMEVLRELAGDRQVILFTCQSREKQIW